MRQPKRGVTAISEGRDRLSLRCWRSCGVPAVLGEVGVQRAAELAISIGRWPVLVVLVAVALAVFYRLGPDRANPRRRWLSWGAVATIVLWLVISAGFSLAWIATVLSMAKRTSRLTNQPDRSLSRKAPGTSALAGGEV